jgi:UDP-glucose 4-epimerase
LSGVLITGGAGYIGSHILHRLHDIGYGGPIICYDNLAAPNSGWVQRYAGLRVGNIKDTGSMTLLCKNAKIDTVMHLAAEIDVTESVADPDKYYRVNTMYTANVVMGAARAGVKNFIFASTAAVYGQAALPLREGADTAPDNPYGRSKLAAEWVVRDLCRQQGLRCVIFRFFNVVGADRELRSGPMHAGSLFKVLARAVLNPGTVVTIHGTNYHTEDGYAVRDYVYVKDIAAAHVAALERLERGNDISGIYNLGTGQGRSVNNVIMEFERVANVLIPRTHGERRPGEVTSAVARVDKAIAAGLLPLRSALSEMVESALDWELKLTKGELVHG